MKDSWRLTHKLSRGRLAGLQVWCSTAHMLQAGRGVADCRWAHATRPIFGRIGRVCTGWVCSGPDVLTASSWCNGQPCRLRSVAICLPPAPGNDHLSFRDVCTTREKRAGRNPRAAIHPYAYPLRRRPHSAADTTPIGTRAGPTRSGPLTLVAPRCTPSEQAGRFRLKRAAGSFLEGVRGRK